MYVKYISVYLATKKNSIPLLKNAIPFLFYYSRGSYFKKPINYGRNCRIIVIADKLQTLYLALIKSHDNRDKFRTESLIKNKV